LRKAAVEVRRAEVPRASSVHGFLRQVRRSLLASTPADRDGSGDLQTLAHRAVVGSMIPCPSQIAVNEKAQVLLFHLSADEFRYSDADGDLADRLLTEFADPNRLGWSEPATGTVALPARVLDLAGPDLFLALRIFENALGAAVRAEVLRLDRLRRSTFENVGFRSLILPTATGKPDPRIGLLRRGRHPLRGRPLSGNDLTRDMSLTASLAVVPDGIESLLQLGRLLYVHGWTEWQFFVAAEHYAVVALDASLRSIYEAWLGPGDVLLVGRRRDNDAGVEAQVRPRYEALRGASQGLADVRVKGRPLPRAKAHFTAHAVREGLLSEWEKRECDALLSLRDDLSHPEFAQIHGISDARALMTTAVRLINLMWVRFHAEVPPEIAWDPANRAAACRSSRRPVSGAGIG
jgi:hypothetical protein